MEYGDKKSFKVFEASPEVTRASPIRKEFMPLFISISISPLPLMPLSATINFPGGIFSAKAAVLNKSVLKVLRSLLFMPMISALYL